MKAMWWWRKVRRATIEAKLRDQCELIGEDVLAHTVSVVAMEISGEKRQQVLEWLQERRDIAERHDDRVETVEWAILIFVIRGVIVESVNLYKAPVH
jgi:hypothetical protein